MEEQMLYKMQVELAREYTYNYVIYCNEDDLISHKDIEEYYIQTLKDLCLNAMTPNQYKVEEPF